MISKAMQQVSSMLVCLTLLTLGAAAQTANGPQDQGPTPTSSQPTPTSAASTAPSAPTSPTFATQTSDQLDALVAPIALYPDALVAQVLGAAAAPDQIAIASYWLGQNKNLT